MKNNQTNKKTNHEVANKTFYPTCRFCKQQILPTAQYDSQEAADESATMNSKCDKAREYQHEIERKNERENNIKKLTQSIDDFATYCNDRGVELKGDLHDILLHAGISVLDEIVDSASFKFYRMKVNISTSSKGNIVIGFTYSDGARMEV